MLIQFRFKNFKSFRDETILDLTAMPDCEQTEEVVAIGKEKILPTAAIFGANGSGKSNVVEAFRFMRTYVLDSFSYGGEPDGKLQDKKKIRCSPFLFDASSRKEKSLFEVQYTDTGKHICTYGFVVGEKGIAEEWLNRRTDSKDADKVIFHRCAGKLDMPGIPEKSRRNLKTALEPESLLISLGAKLKVQELKAVREWFRGVNVADIVTKYEDPVLISDLPNGFADDETVQNRVAKCLASFEPSIAGFRVEKSCINKSCVRIDIVHRTKSGETAAIPLREEPTGIQKMFSLYPVLQNTLESGSDLFADDLDAHLHPLLLKLILTAFLNPEVNKNHAQLIFTTHCSWLLTKYLLRRDEIYFVQKDSDGASTLYSILDYKNLDNIRVHVGGICEKNYLCGKYGAIPDIEGIAQLQCNSIDIAGKYSVSEIANWFLSKESMPIRKLQMLCYYAQAWCYALKEKKLMKTDFYALKQGPTSVELEDAFSEFKYEDIIIGEKLKSHINGENTELLEDVWKTYGDKTDKELTDLAMHEQPWLEAQRNYASGQWDKPLITIESMQKYYRGINDGERLLM